MPTNLELKIRLKSRKRIKNILQQIGAENRGILMQKDIYFSVPQGLLKLRIENGTESLIYYNRNEKGKIRWSNFNFLIFKDGDGEEFFKKIFRIEAAVIKKRELYYYDNTRIHLDSVKLLGNFLELETFVVNGKADARKRFNKIIELLDLQKTAEIRNSYRDILIENNNQK
jgi:predicted adenylyl cyclase CyaB